MDSERLRKLNVLLEENPKDSFLVFAVAKEHEKLGSLERALEYFNMLTESDPNYVGTYYHLGKLHEKLNNPNEAISVYEMGMGIARDINDQHSFNELAEARSALSDDED